MSRLPDCLMSPREVDALVEFATGKKVLELGSWRGATTVHLASVAQVVWSVDHHRGDKFTGLEDTLDVYFDTLERNGIRDKVVSVVADFHDVLWMLRFGRFDLVIVDGAHDVASVQHDIVLAWPLLTSSGTMALHDWGRYDVASTARAILHEPKRVVDSLALFSGPLQP